MGDFLARDAEVSASLAPLGAVSADMPAACPPVGQQMRGFMSQSAVHLRRANGQQAGIQINAPGAGLGGAGRAAHPVVPSDANAGSQQGCSQLFKPCPDLRGEDGIGISRSHF